MTDLMEVFNNLNPRFDDANYDNDGDGLTNKDEVNFYFTDPNLADTDFDGLDDKYEIDHGTSPIKCDTDQDKIIDKNER